MIHPVKNLLSKKIILSSLFLSGLCLTQQGFAQSAGVQCVDTDGDGWGWDGVASCLVENRTSPASDCIDTDGDGWGWNGVDSCFVAGSNPAANTAGNTASAECIDPDGDGWGWNGTDSCLVDQGAASVTTAPTAAVCVDTDGDGWGWNGVDSCLVGSTSAVGNTPTDTSPVASACVDADGDGWGWNGVASCVPGNVAASTTPVTSPDTTPITGTVVITSIDELDVKWGGLPLLADTTNKRLFLSVGEDFTSKTLRSAELTYLHADSGYSLLVNGQQATVGATLDLEIQHGDLFPISIYRGESLFEQYDLVITNLPIVQIVADSIVDEPKLPGTMRWVDGARDIDTGTMPLGIEIRGNSSQAFDKKAFSFEVRDESGDGTNIEFLDLRNDDDWILDAAFRDQSFVRNLVSHDLFRDMRPYAYINDGGEQKGQSTLAGGLAEVILNSRYQGVYVLHERIDRKLLKLSKVDVPEDDTGDRWDLVDFTDPQNGSVLYKASLSATNFYTTDAIESKFEQKYPDEDDITHYQPLLELADFIANSTDSDFNSRVASVVELDSVVDWWLLRLVSANRDAFHRNYYMARSENLKWTVVPWDFDATFGMDWRGGVEPDSVDYYNPSGNRLVGRLTEHPQNGFNALAKARWSELRASLFTADAIADRFAFYAQQVDRGLMLSGETPRQRNLQRWPGTGNTGASNPELGDVEYLRSWLAERLAFVDGVMESL